MRAGDDAKREGSREVRDEGRHDVGVEHVHAPRRELSQAGRALSHRGGRHEGAEPEAGESARGSAEEHDKEETGWRWHAATVLPCRVLR